MSTPKWLSADGLAPLAAMYWKNQAGRLFRQGALTQENSEILKNACRCQALAEVSARAIEAEGILISAGSGGKKTNPAAAVLIQAEREALKLLETFES